MAEMYDEEYDRDGPVVLTGTFLIKRLTEKAVLIWDGEKDRWIPKSQIFSELGEVGEEINELEISEWFYDKMVSEAEA